MDEAAEEARMAKDKKSKSAGVKLPKKLRKLGRKAIKLAEQPVVSEIVAAALLSAAAALRETESGRKSAKRASGDAAAGKLGDSLRKLGLDLARRTLDAWDDSAPPKPPKPSKPSKPPKPPKPPKTGKGKGGGA